MTNRQELEALSDALQSTDSAARKHAVEELAEVAAREKRAHLANTLASDSTVTLRAYTAPLLSHMIAQEQDQRLLFAMLRLAELIGPTGSMDMPLALVESLKSAYDLGEPIWTDVAHTLSRMGDLPWIGIALDKTKGMGLFERRAIITTLAAADPDRGVPGREEGVLWMLSQSTDPDDTSLLIELNVFFAKALGGEKVKHALLECDKRTGGEFRADIEYDLREIGYTKVPLIGWVYTGTGRSGINREGKTPDA